MNGSSLSQGEWNPENALNVWTPKKVDSFGSKEGKRGNFYEEKREAWVRDFEDKKTASDIAQSLRAALFALPEGKTPRTTEETHQLYKSMEDLVRQYLWSDVFSSNRYGDGYNFEGGYVQNSIRHRNFTEQQRSSVFQFIDHTLPSVFHEDPKRDLESLSILLRSDTEFFMNELDSLLPILRSSDRFSLFSSAMTSSLEYDERRRYVEAMKFFYEASSFSYRVDDSRFKKEKKEHEVILKDDVFFQTVMKTCEQLFNTGNVYISDSDFQRVQYMHRDTRIEYIKKVESFEKKGFDARVLLQDFDYLQHADVSKEGFDMFSSASEKAQWLRQCFSHLFEQETKDLPVYKQFITEALAVPQQVTPYKKNIVQIKGVSTKMAGEIDQEIAEQDHFSLKAFKEKEQLQWNAKQLFSQKFRDTLASAYIAIDVFETIGATFGEPGVQLMREFDKTYNTHLSKDQLARFVSCLQSPVFKQYLPHIHEAVDAQIVQLVGTDAKIRREVVENFRLFLTHPKAEQMARVLIQTDETAKILYQKFHGFHYATVPQNIPVWMKDLLKHIENTYGIKALKPQSHSYSSGGSEGFRSKDPYEKSLHKYGGTGKRLQEVMSGKKTPEEIGLELKPEFVEYLSKVNRILDTEHDKFLDAIRSNIHIPSEDKIALINAKESLVKMNDLKDSIRAFLARYLVQMSEGDLQHPRVPIERISSLLKSAYEHYLDVYATDIPLYDKLYEEFDDLRESGRSSLEVYLGRDGIYAYIGRKAQDATRKSVLGKEKIHALQEEGEVIAIQPKYLVYPSYVRDSMTTQTKQEYLTAEGVTEESDPLFYDTGFSGSIPVDIMNVMGFDPSEIEERIRLLSAQIPGRRMRKIVSNAREDIIAKIEGNPKSEQTTRGLVKNPETGRISPLAEPASPEDQFKFSFIRQAIARHYLIQEKLHYIIPENTFFNSEHYTLRIRSEYAEKLPEAFKKDPIQFLETQGTKEEGVILMKLEDGTEVVARRIEWGKAAQAQTEYAILISAKKAGLPSAEPVGFVKGKTEGSESILLSKKIEGVPGRRFEKTLREAGTYSEEQIRELMQELEKQIIHVTQLLKDSLQIVGEWKIIDVAVQFNKETGQIESVIPLKWERIKQRDEQKEQVIMDLIEGSYRGYDNQEPDDGWYDEDDSYP